jgi:succinate dehydrogenase/fumarate reductase flavoprotein subunit
MGRAVNVLHGRGYQIDIVEHIRGCADLVEQHDGHVVLDTQTECLLTDERGAVTGARTSHSEGTIDVLAPMTIIATGGFQNSSELRASFIHRNARDRVLLRTNPQSQGDGMRIALDVGAVVTNSNAGFYGHLVSESPRWGDPGLYTLLTQYHSEHALLFNEEGHRFCDESLGDHVSTNRLVTQNNARAICFWDARIHEVYGTTPIVKGSESVDKMQVALDNGGRGVVADSIAEVSRFASAHGFNGAQMCRSIDEYNRRCRTGWETLDPRRAENFGALDRAPYYALIVLPAITHTHDGLRIDPKARVLQGDGSPVPGLLAAGADAGDVYGSFGLYAGGLGMALAFGVQAAITAGFNPVRPGDADP